MFREQEKLQLLKRLRQSLAPDAPWVGFYTAGEISPSRSTTFVICTRLSSLPSVDDGTGHTSVTFEGGEAYPEQVGGLAPIHPSAHGSDFSDGK